MFTQTARIVLVDFLGTTPIEYYYGLGDSGELRIIFVWSNEDA